MLTHKLSHDGYFVYRRPILPAHVLDAYLEKHGSGSECEYHQALSSLLENEMVNDAILAGNPGLHKRLLADNSAEKNPRILFSALRYLVRMATRATPFGAYACVGTGDILDEPREPYSPGKIWCDLDIDSAVLLEFDSTIKRSIPRNEQVIVRAANVLYAREKSIRYFERHLSKNLLKYELSETSATEVLRLVCRLTKAPKSIGDIASAIAEVMPGCGRSEIVNYLFKLLDGGLIQLDADVPMTSGHRLPQYLRKLEQVFPGVNETPAFRHLDELRGILEPGVRHSLSEAASRVKQTENIAAELGYTLRSGHVVHVDTFCDDNFTGIMQDEFNQLSNAIDTLRSVLPHTPNVMLRDLAQAIEARFGNEFVDLMVALDPETGIKFGRAESSPKWTKNVRIRPKHPGENNASEQFFLSLLSHEAVSGSGVIDLARFMKPKTQSRNVLPSSLSACVSVYSSAISSTPNVKPIPLILLNFLHGAGGVGVNARFGARNEEIAARLRQTVCREDSEDDEAIYAEVVHLPVPRHGNVVTRPPLRAYELVLSGAPSVPEANQIRPDELIVGVIGGEVVLWCTRLQKRVIPRFSSTYNFAFTGNLNLYRFLCVLASPPTHVPMFQWPRSAQTCAFLPRVTVGNVIVSKARWRLNRSDIESFHSIVQRSAWGEMHEFLSHRGLPKWFSIEDHDNLLEVQSNVPMSLRMMDEEISGKDVVFLCEAPARLGESVKECNEAVAFSEIVLPIHVHGGEKQVRPERTNSTNQLLQAAVEDYAQSDVLARDWYYIKLYGCEEALETWLLKDVFPFLNSLNKANGALPWHFVRYRDPEFHFRLRVRVPPSAETAFFERLRAGYLEPARANGVLENYLLDVYRPEFHRYGGKALMATVEAIFWRDSCFAENVIGLTRASGNDDNRFRAALVGTLEYLCNFGLAFDEARSFVSMQRLGFLAEMNISAADYRALSDLYKTYRRYIEDAIECSTNSSASLQDFVKFRSVSVKPLVDVMLGAAPLKLFTEILPSLIHMQSNRIFVGNSRPQEFIVWDFLERGYRSVAARKRAGAIAEAAVTEKGAFQ